VTAAGDFGRSRCTSPVPASREHDPELISGRIDGELALRVKAR